jgi:hypothetical protein
VGTDGVEGQKRYQADAGFGRKIARAFGQALEGAWLFKEIAA